MKTLPKLSEYVKSNTQLNAIDFEICAYDVLKYITNYTNFLTQPLKLSHFVPAIEKDGKWIVLEEPKNFKEWCKKALNTPYDLDLSKYKEYQTALDNVVFKGCGLMDGWCLQFADGTLFDDIKNINKYTFEDIITYNLEVNENIIKKFGL